MSVPKALRLCVSRVADKLFGLPVTVIGIVPDQISGEKIADALDDTSMLVLLDGPYRASGGISLGHELVTALVQQQTMGKVIGLPEEPRVMTSTDASLCAPLIDSLIHSVYAILETDDDRRLLGPYAFGAKCQNARVFGMALNAITYQTYKMTLDIDAGAFQSGLTLFVPVLDAREKIPDPFKKIDEPEAPREPAMFRTAMALPAELSAVLLRERMTLSRLSKLRVGDTIALPPTAFDAVEIVAKTGRRICHGSLGQMDGMRALQLNTISAGRPSTISAKSGEDARGGETEEAGLPTLGALANLSDVDSAAALPDFGHAGDGLPDLADLPDLPDLPDFSDNDSAGALPDLPDFDDAAALPDLSDLPDLDSAGSGDDEEAAAALPDLPDLDSLPDLPELDDLPKLNSA